jgi:surfactin synthase thioesterase subunit
MSVTKATAPEDSCAARPALIPLTSHRTGTQRLFCFPPAGTGPSCYLPWAARLPPAIELFTFHLPGRENHPSHVSVTDPRQLVRDLAGLIPADNPEVLGFFGHSIGALLAFETACRLRRTQSRTPDLLAVSGLPAPHLDILQSNILNAVFDGVAKNGDLLSPLANEAASDTRQKILHYAPMVADSLLILHYRHSAEAPLDSHLAILGGESDPFTPMAALTAWNDLVTMPATPRLYPGGHLYLYDHTPAVIENLIKDLKTAASS